MGKAKNVLEGVAKMMQDAEASKGKKKPAKAPADAKKAPPFAKKGK